ncbi:MAG: argininosuccinate lyase [Clostridiales bacterium]|nr:argininosuccinate lyase [Clostridiales bacterium]
MKLWQGRIQADTDAQVNSFNTSLPFDQRMYSADITGSMAHAKMLAAQGIITGEDAESILAGLTSILKDIETGVLTFDNDSEDIHMFVEEELTKRIGDPGRRLHTARSRNDQVALDLRLYLLKEEEELIALLRQLIALLAEMAEEHAEVVMPGYTHLQRAQPITFGHHLLAYGEMFLRDLERLQQCMARTKVLPLGSGALAGTTYPIDRHMVAEALGFTAVSRNSLDGVSDRDFAIELAADLSLISMHLSRFSEEIILWCSWEFKFIELDDAFSTGSSIMPQKKNPDVAELVRGKTGRVYGDLMALLTALKGLPLAYNKDMQEDKEAIFDAVDTVKECLKTFTPMLSTIRVLPGNMRKAAAKGFINATDLADYLTKKGMPFRSAYKISGSLVGWCIAHDTVLEDLPLDFLKEQSELFEEDVYEAISLETCVKGRTSYGGPAPDQVKMQAAQLSDRLADL